jgi:hypothetical protein
MYDIFIHRIPIKCLNNGSNSFPENSRREEFIINPAQADLQEFKGYLQVDDDTVYEYFYDKPDIIILNFNQHSRRKFNAALNNDSSKLLYAITKIQKLYAIKRDVVEAYLTEDAKLKYCKIHAVCLLETVG